MAIKTVKFYNNSDCCLDACSGVVVCLIDDWKARTVNGTGLIYGKLKSSHKVNFVSSGCSTTQDGYEYVIYYEDSQLNIDPETSEPYILSPSDIESLAASPCVVKKLIEYTTSIGAGNITTPINFSANSGAIQPIQLGGSLEISGSNPVRTSTSPNQINVVLDVSPDIGNIIQIRPSGIYVPTPSSGGGGGGSPITIGEQITECSRSIRFQDGDALDFTLLLHDKKIVNHPAHGFGAAGTFRPLKPAFPVYALAQADSQVNVASHIGLVIDDDNYYLLSPGFYSLPGHGFDLGSQYVVSGATAGAFTKITDLSEDYFFQHAFRVETANCLYVNLQEADAPSSCCNIINQTAHGFSAGQPVYYDTGDSEWKLAVATSPGAVMVLRTIDADFFVVGLTGCIYGIAGLTHGASYSVSPGTPGILVDSSTLNCATNEPLRPVGVALGPECLTVNMWPHFIYLGGACS